MDLTEADLLNIEKAIAEGGDLWKSSHVQDFKTRIKDYYRKLLHEQCCYCRKNTHGEFRMVLDIEHILPKANPKFRRFIFIPTNLSVACKRCNMQIKKDRVDFITDLEGVVDNHTDSKFYKIIHPNSDKYFDHLRYYFHVEDDKKVIKYKVVASSEKGQFTYDFFKLRDLEVESINQAQGTKPKHELSEKIDNQLQERLQAMLDNI